MQSTDRYLVVLGNESTDPVALKRALAIAELTGAELHLLHCARSSNDTHIPWPEASLNEARDKGIPYSMQTAWNHSELDTVMKCLEERGPFEMVIKANEKQHGILSTVFTPSDWKLLRKCPIPALLVKKTNQSLSGPVLAAVYPESPGANEQGLNGLVLRSAFGATRLRGGPLHLAAAYPAPMQAGFADSQSEEAIAKRYLAYCSELCDENEIIGANIHVDEGPVESMLPELSKSLDASLVVLGTLARDGINGALMGNTAEQVLSQINSDILVLKPDHAA